LLGIYDTAAGSADYGLGVNGPGNYPAMSYPIQVVFGGPDAYRFQGVMTQFDYTFTLFDSNMIPIEAFADIGLMRVYQPSMSSPALSNSLFFSSGNGKGSQYMQQKQPQSSSSKPSTFNAPAPKKAAPKK
jgi:hypothetical protein